ncbi:uncharacterized protein TrAtP1_003415 [Trichoderma atroviride]|uniref:uncharacterized protein n=1 Tax=Hypocrea atroviridis TaxID=63577 RepID=UPI00332401C1|nr:hypothetical protein TrAtP1_003415 [Trichoderma atroviride]
MPPSPPLPAPPMLMLVPPLRRKRGLILLLGLVITGVQDGLTTATFISIWQHY